MRQALQRTPDGAAELGRAEHRQLGRHGPCGRKARAAGGRAARHRHQSQRACARGLRDKARRAFSPPVLGRRCGVNCCAIQHNGLLHARPAFRSPSSLPPGMRATPVMSCAPPRLRGASARSTEPMPRQYRCSCAPGVPAAQVTESGALRAQSWSWPPPARHPPPEGAPWLPPLSLLSVAPCSPRQGFASPLRALDPAARGTP